MSAIRFDGQVAIVTGAGRGIGKAHAMELAQRGCKVIVGDLADASGKSAAAQQVVDEIAAAGGTALADCSNIVDDAAGMVRRAVDAFGRLDIVVNNAGIHTEEGFATTPVSTWNRHIDVHFRGTVEVTRAAWPHLVASGAGRIVNTASAAIFGNGWTTAYGSAKAAIMGFTRNLSIEAKDVGINVNCILPNAWTPMAGNVAHPPDIKKVMQEQFRPECIAAFVAWLAHKDTQVTGQFFRVSAGRASRVVLAVAPLLRAVPDTPEGWAAQAAALLDDSAELTPINSAIDAFFSELAAADPSLAKYQAGAASLKIDRG